MKKNILACSAFILTLSLCSLVLALPTVDPEVYFDFNGDTFEDLSIGPIIAGSIFSADIYIDSIGEAERGLMSMGLEFSFDPSQIQVNSLEKDSSIWVLNTPPASIDNSVGISRIVGSSLSLPIPTSGPTGKIHLASVEFSCVAVGISDITLYDYLPSNPNIDSFVSYDGTVFDQDISFKSTSVTQAPIPEPTTIFLFGTGIAGLAAVGRRKKK